MRRLVISILLVATAATASSAGAQSYDRFQSPSGNIRCEYVSGRGVACMTMHNGLGVVLRSFDRAYYLNRPYAFQPRAGRTLYYGQTWRVSTFRCKSETNGIQCSSTVTGRGFFINRSTRHLF